MEECMICYDLGAQYQLKGCKHSICTTCANKLKQVPSCIKHPFSNKITVLLPVHDTILKCPYCTVSEPSCHNLDQLQREYPHQYRVWIEAEMRYHPDRKYTFFTFADQVKYSDSKRRKTSISYHYYDENEFIDCVHELRPFKITYVDPYSKYQVYEKRLRPIQRRPKHF